MSFTRGLSEFDEQVRRHPFFYEPTLVAIGLLVPAVLARRWLPSLLGVPGWLAVTAGGITLWAVMRLVPLARFVPDEQRDRSNFFRSLAANPIGSMVFGFGGGYLLVRTLNALVPAMEIPPHFAGLVGGVVIGLPIGASVWVSAFGYAAQRNRARTSRSRPAV